MDSHRAASPRFKQPAVAPRFSPTGDDETIIKFVYDHRIADSKMIYRRLPHRSRQQLSRRLNGLRKARYLARLPQQTARFQPGGGSEHLFYVLDRAGARHIRETWHIPVPLIHWTQKNQGLKLPSIDHALNTSRIVAGLECALPRYDGLALVPFVNLLEHHAPERTRVTWRGSTSEKGIRPDCIFALMATGRSAPNCYFLQNDEGTETFEPSLTRKKLTIFFRQNSILRKFVLYAATFHNRTHEQRFGMPSFQVLMVTTTAVRALNMIDAYQRLIRPEPVSAPAGLFLFTDRATVAAHDGDLLAVPWQNGAGKQVLLSP
jgi:Replication-relaxation